MKVPLFRAWIALILVDHSTNLSTRHSGKDHVCCSVDSVQRQAFVFSLRGGIGSPEPEQWRHLAVSRGCSAFATEGSEEVECKNQDPILMSEQSSRKEEDTAGFIHQDDEDLSNDSPPPDLDRDPYGDEAASIGRYYLLHHRAIPRNDFLPCRGQMGQMEPSISLSPLDSLAYPALLSPIPEPAG